jgi:hypothetical protein
LHRGFDYEWIADKPEASLIADPSDAVIVVKEISSLATSLQRGMRRAQLNRDTG